MQHMMAQATRLRPYRPSGLYRTDPPAAELQAAASVRLESASNVLATTSFALIEVSAGR